MYPSTKLHDIQNGIAVDIRLRNSNNDLSHVDVYLYSALSHYFSNINKKSGKRERNDC